MLTSAHVYIKGIVIGVSFRAWLKQQADALGISGWTRNNYDRPEIFGGLGGVEAVFVGEESQVKQIVELAKKGSPVSKVEGVDVYWETPREKFEGFEIKR